MQLFKHLFVTLKWRNIENCYRTGRCDAKGHRIHMKRFCYALKVTADIVPDVVPLVLYCTLLLTVHPGPLF